MCHATKQPSCTGLFALLPFGWEIHAEVVQQPLCGKQNTAWLPICLPGTLQLWLWYRLSENLLWHASGNREAKHHCNRLECCVENDILLDVLEIRFGILEDAIKWFESYLPPRTLNVDVSSFYSSPTVLEFSVPQSHMVYGNTMQHLLSTSMAMPTTMY